MKRHKMILPLWAYFLMNLLVLGVFYGIYWGAMVYSRANNFVIVGLVPILAVCYLAFLSFSVMDVLIDRFSKEKNCSPQEKKQDLKKNDPA